MTDTESIADEESKENRGRNPHVVFVDGTGDDNRLAYEDDIVDAETIIEDAGYDESPEEYILEALKGQSEEVDEQFDPQGEAGPSQVDLTEQHRKHFQVTTRGEVFI